MRFLVLVLLLSSAFSCSLKQQEKQSLESNENAKSYKIELFKSSALKNKMHLLLPVDFKLMSDEEILVKYSRASSTPQEAYSNSSGTISLAFNHTSNALSPLDLPDFRQSFARQFKSTLGIDFIGSSMKKINGRDFATLEFISPAMDSKIYNLMFLTSLDDRLLICTFNCTENEMEKWKSTSQKIMNSIKVVE